MYWYLDPEPLDFQNRLEEFKITYSVAPEELAVKNDAIAGGTFQNNATAIFDNLRKKLIVKA